MYETERIGKKEHFPPASWGEGPGKNKGPGEPSAQCISVYFSEPNFFTKITGFGKN